MALGTKLTDEEREALSIALTNIANMSCADEIVEGMTDEQIDAFYNLIDKLN